MPVVLFESQSYAATRGAERAYHLQEERKARTAGRTLLNRDPTISKNNPLRGAYLEAFRKHQAIQKVTAIIKKGATRVLALIQRRVT